jgi:hypothetical protein
MNIFAENPQTVRNIASPSRFSQSKTQIIAPRPLKKKSIHIPTKQNMFLSRKIIGKNNSNFDNNSENNSDTSRSKNPFQLAKNISRENSFLENSKIPNNCKRDISLNTSLNGRNFTPMVLSEIPLHEIEQDFNAINKNLQSEIKENEAKDEILSILSTDHSDSARINGNKLDIKDIRSSMPALRPQNPFLKNFSKLTKDSKECLDKSKVSFKEVRGFFENSILRHSLLCKLGNTNQQEKEIEILSSSFINNEYLSNTSMSEEEGEFSLCSILKK